MTITDDGYTKIDEAKAPNCEIGISIYKDQFIKRMIARLMRQDLGVNSAKKNM